MKFIILMLIFLSSCTSLPKGKLQLKKMIEDDLPKDASKGIEYVHSGRPIYIEAASYPYLLADGHISINGKILIYAGREELSLKELLPSSPIGEKNTIEHHTPEREIPFHKASIKEDLPTNEASEIKLRTNPIFPVTAITKTYEDYLKLKQASISKKDQRVTNHYHCAKAKVTKQGNCNDLKVEFNLSKCLGSLFTKQAYQVSCGEKEALFGVRLNDVRYRVKARPSTTQKSFWNLVPKFEVMLFKHVSKL